MNCIDTVLAIVAALAAVQVPPEPAHEHERQRKPDHAPARGLFHRDLVRALFFHDQQVDGNGHHHKDGKARPHPPGSDGFHLISRRD
jgi:hypothetical protein